MQPWMSHTLWRLIPRHVYVIILYLHMDKVEIHTASRCCNDPYVTRTCDLNNLVILSKRLPPQFLLSTSIRRCQSFCRLPDGMNLFGILSRERREGSSMGNSTIPAEEEGSSSRSGSQSEDDGVDFVFTF